MHRIAAAVAVAVALGLGTAHAAGSWLIGQTADFSGPQAAAVKETTEAARAYFDTVNKKGENSFLLDTAIDSPQDLNPKIPPAESNLVMECIATKPSKRPADMDQMINRLELGKHILL